MGLGFVWDTGDYHKYRDISSSHWKFEFLRVKILFGCWRFNPPKEPPKDTGE